MAGHGGGADQVGERVESLLAQLRRQGGDPAAATGEDLVALLVDFYGAGLERLVSMVGEAHPELVLAAAGDQLVESQLILHGLHPLSADERIEQALDRVRPYLGSHAGGVAYLGIDDAAVAHLRLDGSCNGCPSSTVTVRLTIEDAVLGAAPEVVGVEVDGQAEKPKPLLQIGLRPGAAAAPAPAPPSAPAPTARWLHPRATELPLDGQARQVLLDGRPVLMCRLRGTYYAYADSCPACAGSLADARIDGDRLGCPSCGLAYDIRLAGRSLDGSDRFLDPLPLLDDVSGIRVALVPEAV